MALNSSSGSHPGGRAWFTTAPAPDPDPPSASELRPTDRSGDASATPGREPNLNVLATVTDDGRDDTAIVRVAHELRAPLPVLGGVSLLDRLPGLGQVFTRSLAIRAPRLDIHDHAHDLGGG